jgi:hypothetical protein
MSLRYESLSQNANAFATFTGIPLSLFQSLLPDLLAEFHRQRRRKLSGRDRQRAFGGGDSFDLDPTHQLLLTLIHLKRYPTYDELAYHFAVSKATISRAIERGVRVLESDAAGQLQRAATPSPSSPTSDESVPRLCESPSPDEPSRGSKGCQSAATASEQKPTPKKRRAKGSQKEPRMLVVDSFEQATQRPKYHQKKYYSGKKKDHTIKSLIVVEEKSGKVVLVSESVPGPTADIKLLEKSEAMEKVPEGCGMAADTAFIGMEKLAGAEGRKVLVPRRKPKGKERSKEDRKYNRKVSRRRIVVEHTIGRMRRFACLMVVYRHKRASHRRRVRAVAGLVNRLIGLANAA